MSPGSSDAAQSFPLGEMLGLELDVVAGGVAEGGFDVDALHLNPNGVVHGAALFTLLDTLMGAATMSSLPDAGRCTTADLHIRYLRPVESGRVTGRAEVAHMGQRLVILRGELRNGRGEMVAIATATFSVAPGPSPE